MDEIRIPNAELRSSGELLIELQKTEGRESCLAQSKTSIQETGAAQVSIQTCNKETCANTLSIPPSRASFFTQRTIPTTERKWKVIPANSSYGGVLSIAVSKMGTRMVRYCDQDERQSDAALHWDTTRSVLLKAFAKHGLRDFPEKYWLRLVHEGSSKTSFEFFVRISPNSLAYFRAFQGHPGGMPIGLELLGYIRIPHNLEEYFSQRLFFQHSVYP